MKRFLSYLRSVAAPNKTRSQKAAQIDDAERVIVNSSALHCPVCLCVFASAPFILQCGHSFCQRCIRRLVENSYSELGGQVFECPMCRQMVSCGTRFTKNYLADALLQSLCDVQDEKECKEYEMDCNLRLSYKLVSQRYVEEQEKNNILRRKYEEERIRSRRYLVLLAVESAMLIVSAFLYGLLGA